MLKKCVTITLIITILLGFNFSPIEAGAILNLYCIDLPNGKRIIMFGERHVGTIDTAHGEIPVQQVEQNQHLALSHLFGTDFGPKRHLIGTYLECNDALCENFKERMIAKLKTGQSQKISEFLNNSWFDHYYRLFYAMGTDGANDVASIQNFDGRSSLDLAILFSARKLSKITDNYIKSNFDKTYLYKAKKKFLESEEYKIFKSKEENWLKVITEPVIAAAIRLHNKVTQQVSDQMFNKIHKKRAILDILNSKAKFLNQDVFQFLFNILESTKDKFNEMLPELCRVQGSHEMQVWDAFDLSNVGPDLQLVEKVLSDPHSMVLVHCGNTHALHAFKYFKMMHEDGVRAKSASLITQPLMNNEQTYQVMREFISN